MQPIAGRGQTASSMPKKIKSGRDDKISVRVIGLVIPDLDKFSGDGPVRPAKNRGGDCDSGEKQRVCNLCPPSREVRRGIDRFAGRIALGSSDWPRCRRRAYEIGPPNRTSFARISTSHERIVTLEENQPGYGANRNTPPAEPCLICADSVPMGDEEIFTQRSSLVATTVHDGRFATLRRLGATRT